MRYLRLLILSATVSFATIWLWIAAMPMAYMDIEYPSWRAKRLLLDRCELGETVILGDSRAASDILPLRLPFPATNLAIGGGEPIEAYGAMVRALRCPSPPKYVILSIVPTHFAYPDMFWDRTVRFGYFDPREIATLRDVSRESGDMSVYESSHDEGLPWPIRDRLYQMRFPSLYFASLVHGGGFLRWVRNRRMLNETLNARGQYYFGTGAGSDIVAIEGHVDSFRPLPVLDRYFDRLLALLDQRGIETLFLAMPVNEATWRQVQPLFPQQFLAYLTSYERRYPHFHVAADIMPHWPDRLFGDQFCHLNPDGAERFSDQLGQRLQAAPPRTQNDAQNGWLSGTARDASARVLPISKRGS